MRSDSYSIKSVNKYLLTPTTLIKGYGRLGTRVDLQLEAFGLPLVFHLYNQLEYWCTLHTTNV